MDPWSVPFLGLQSFSISVVNSHLGTPLVKDEDQQGSHLFGTVRLQRVKMAANEIGFLICLISHYSLLDLATARMSYASLFFSLLEPDRI